MLSEPFIKLVFGDSWLLTASILTWLAPTGIVQAVLSTSGTIFMAKGKTYILMKLGFLGMILQVSSFILGVQFDIVTFAKFLFHCKYFKLHPCDVVCIKNFRWVSSRIFFEDL
ncbi:hypothetical protein [Klebsiella michiganensis]|uniref:hypothetical protein n=1 Tax=Klebsiella michiganensis TaxID=1134687 RepID=UPI001F461083|nr:hypothetical protein [Klebsiella michiganensis]